MAWLVKEIGKGARIKTDRLGWPKETKETKKAEG
jgi:hypothetical protein